MSRKRYRLVSESGLFDLCSSIVLDHGGEVEFRTSESTKKLTASAVEMLSRLYLVTLPREDPIIFLESVVDKIARQLDNRYGQIQLRRLIASLGNPVQWIHGQSPKMEYITYYELVYDRLPERSLKSGLSWLSRDMEDLEKIHGKEVRTKYLTVLFEMFKRGMNILPQWEEIEKLVGKREWTKFLSLPFSGYNLGERTALALRDLEERGEWMKCDLSDIIIKMNSEG